MMRLKVLAPSGIMLEEEVSKVLTEGEEGAFTLLPRHIDYATTLVPGILTYVTAEERQGFVAVDEGVLVKRGREVLVSTRNAVLGDDLESLRQAVDEQFRALDEEEKRARTALAKLEASFVRRYMDLRERVRE